MTTLNDLLQTIPVAAKILGGWVTGIFSFYVSYRVYKRKQIQSKSALLEEYKAMYIKQSMEVMKLLEGSAKKRKVLIEMKNFCPSCYNEVVKKLNYNDELEKDL